MSRCRLIFFCALLCCGRAEATTAVWIDTDPAIGAPWREVDDAFALLLVFHSPEVKIVGLSTTYGNAALPRTTAVARDLVQRFGQRAGLREDMVHPGARSPRDRTAKTEATEGLASALRERRLTYIALGPLTNLATFLALHPDLADRIDRIILVGGRTPETRFAFGPNKSFRVHDANVFKDPAAVAMVLQSSRPLLLVPIALAPKFPLTRPDLRALGRSGPAGNYLFHRSRVWNWFWTEVVREQGGLAFDVSAIFPVLRPEFLKTETRYGHLDHEGDLVAERKRRLGARRLQFGTGLDARAKAIVLDRLGTSGTR